MQAALFTHTKTAACPPMHEADCFTDIDELHQCLLENLAQMWATPMPYPPQVNMVPGTARPSFQVYTDFTTRNRYDQQQPFIEALQKDSLSHGFRLTMSWHATTQLVLFRSGIIVPEAFEHIGLLYSPRPFLYSLND